MYIVRKQRAKNNKKKQDPDTQETKVPQPRAKPIYNRETLEYENKRPSKKIVQKIQFNPMNKELLVLQGKTIQ